MRRLVIDKFIEGVHQERINVPLFAVKFLHTILPPKGISLLAEMSLDLGEITEAGQKDIKFEKTIDVIEHDVPKKVVLSI